MKNLIFLTAFITFIFSWSSPETSKPAGVPPYAPESKAIHDTVARLDSMLFDAYNTCKLDVFASMVSSDIEFYHDRGGLSTSKPDLVTAIKNNICGKVRRELLAGSIEVYPIPGYGAVEMGAHRFYNNQEKERGPSRFSKFVHIWHRENDGWKLARVVSLH